VGLLGLRRAPRSGHGELQAPGPVPPAPAADRRRTAYPDPTEFSATQLLLRQYACPGCATLLAQEFCLADDEPWHDFRIDLDAA
jgi:acetone carboxylase gamma subunit